MIIWVEILGLIAGAIIITASAPQLIKIIKTKKTRDISLLFITITLSGLFLWLIYGLLIDSLALIISNAITFSLWFIMLLLKLKYK